MKLVLESQEPEKDIEAIAKSRVMRAEGNKQTFWIIGSVVLVLGGMLVRTTHELYGWVMCGVGLLAFIYYMQTLSKKQKNYKNEMLDDWQKEQREVAQPQKEEENK